MKQFHVKIIIVSFAGLVSAGCDDVEIENPGEPTLTAGPEADEDSRDTQVRPPRDPHWLEVDGSSTIVWSRSVDDGPDRTFQYEVCGAAGCNLIKTNHLLVTGRAPFTVRAIDEDGVQSEPVALAGDASDPAFVPLFPRASLPTQVASPIYGPLANLPAPTNCPGQADGRWGFCQHQTGEHVGNSKYCWDINDNWAGYGTDLDDNAEFTAVGWGNVVLAAGGAYNTIQVEHKSNNVYWYTSEYLHAASASVKFSDMVTPLTILGRIGATGATNDHLHLCTKQKVNGVLVSFNTSFVENTAAIGLSGASEVAKGQSTTISGTGYRTNNSAGGSLSAVALNSAAAYDQTWWTSSNPAVAKVDGWGKVTGVAAGVATITLRWHGVLKSRAITVK